MARPKGLSLQHLTEADFPVLRLGYQERLELSHKYQGWLEDSSLQDYLAACPRPGERGKFLTAGCHQEMCRDGAQEIFINSRGEFRRKIKSRPRCLSQQSDCVKVLEEYLESNPEQQYKYDERAQLTCRKDSFRNVDSGSDLQCSWLGSGGSGGLGSGLEQAECLERKYKYQPRTFTANQIVCCRDSRTTVFNPQAPGENDNSEVGPPRCSEGLLNQCKQEWTDWSGWEVAARLTILLTD